MRCLVDQLRDLLHAQLPGFGDARRLPQGGGRGQAVIQSARRSGDQLHRNPGRGVRVGDAQGLHSFADGFIQRRIAGGEVAAAGCQRIIRHLRRGGWATLEIARRGKVLPDKAGTAHFAVNPQQRAVGLLREPPLS